MKRTLDRRRLMKTAGAAVAAGASSAIGVRPAAAGTAGEPQIRIAGYDYDRVRAIVDGQIGLPGYQVAFEYQDIYTANGSAFGPEQPYEVTEIGLIPFVTKFVNEDFRAYTLIPAFVSRIFRHRNVFVHTDAGIEKPEDRRGKRVGTPGYGSSANTWIRGLLSDEYGVEPHELEWVETAKSSDSGPVGGGGFNTLRDGDSPYFLPDDFPLRQGPPGADESELLLARECHAVIAPITPKAFEEGHPKVRRLFQDAAAEERRYFEKTGVFPIMHAVAIRADAIEADPGLPVAVLELYEQAKAVAYANMETTTSLRVTLPWVAQELEKTRALMGRDFWRYGVEANRKELGLVMRYMHEQRLVRERRGFDGLFHASTR